MMGAQTKEREQWRCERGPARYAQEVEAAGLPDGLGVRWERKNWVRSDSQDFWPEQLWKMELASNEKQKNVGGAYLRGR